MLFYDTVTAVTLSISVTETSSSTVLSEKEEFNHQSMVPKCK